MKISKSAKTSKYIKLEIKDGKKVVGRAFLYVIKNDLHERPYGLLEDLFVSEAFRGQGLGRALLSRVLTEAKRLKLYKIVGTSRTSRAAVHAMYIKFGFKKYGYEFRINL